MHKITPSKPILIMLYGFPGSGKTHFARQLALTIAAAHVDGDRIRSELFENPTRSKQENDVIENLMTYMTNEFLSAGVSVIYDYNAMRLAQRRELRDMARKHHGDSLIIWLQIDTDSAFNRVTSRDKRKSDDKYALGYDKQAFDSYIAHMQNPTNEDYIVISGKHTFVSQKGAVIKKLYDLSAIDADTATSRVIKPGLVNLVPKPNSGRVDLSRRNIIIR